MCYFVSEVPAVSRSEIVLLKVAERLTRSAGRPHPVAIERISGGRNNRAFRLVVADGPPLFLKSYFCDPRDTRQRLAAEWGFLSFAWLKGIRSIPEPLAADWQTHTGLYTFVTGQHLHAGEISAGHVDIAADFVLGVNATPRVAEQLPPGSEACFSLAQHLETINRRVGQLGTLDPGAPHRDDAERFVHATLMPTWHEVKNRIEIEIARLGLSLKAELTAEETVISPSDFGFHNALVEDGGRIVFTDFEYAGRDDPAKLVCDFFCQPDVPIPFEHYRRFVDRLTAGLGLGPAHEMRCRLLLDAYRIKWICIILNDFRLVGGAQRTFAGGESWVRRCEAQLRIAESKIAEISIV
jgi:hypothetical protein